MPLTCCLPQDIDADAVSHQGRMEPQYITEADCIAPNKVDDDPSMNIIYPNLYKDHFSSLLIPHSTIHKRTTHIAKTISDTYHQSKNNEPIVLVCILKGSSPFYNQLASELSLLGIPYLMEFIRVKSYVGNESSGNVKVYSVEMPKSIQNRHVLVVEDIVDTGTTLKAIMPKFEECQPKSVEVCTLLEKRLDNTTVQEEDRIVAKYVGFSIPDEFVVGYGLDYNEMYRDLRDIWILGQKGIELGGYGDC